MSAEQPNPRDDRTDAQNDRRVLHARVVGPDDWAQARQLPVPVRLVRTVQSGIGIGVGIVIVQAIAALIAFFVIGAGLFAV
jgi:hypothetical protein